MRALEWQTSTLLICLVVRSRLKLCVSAGGSGWREVLLCHDSSQWQTCVCVFFGGGERLAVGDLIGDAKDDQDCMTTDLSLAA